jgi:predicted RNA-binding protein Jag
MDVQGDVSGTGDETRIHLAVTAERAGRIVGKRGSTLGSIRHLLSLALLNGFGDLVVDVDIADNRPRDNRSRGDRDDSRKRDRDDSRRRDRGGRERKRGGRDRRRNDNERTYPEDKLQALAQKAASKAVETGQTITINLLLNSYDRRIVHMEIAEIDGVSSSSEETSDGTGKVIKVMPETSVD